MEQQRRGRRQHRVQLTAPAGAGVNEDAWAADDRVTVVVDGAGLPKSARQGCSHEVAWWAQRLAANLLLAAGSLELSLQEALSQAILDTNADHGPGCRLDQGSPSGTVAVWRTNAEMLEYLVLCDASIVYELSCGAVQHISDTRLAQFVVEHLDPYRAGPHADPHEIQRLRAERMKRVEHYRNTPGGFWCAHYDPAVAQQALVGSEPLNDVVAITLASDGAMRGVELLGIHSPGQLTDARTRAAQHQLVDEIRSAETRLADQLRDAGNKVHDDVTMITTWWS